jgi:hypothetical protein
VIALPEFELLLDVVGDHLLLSRPLQAQKVNLVPLTEVLLDAEVADHVPPEEGEVVGDGDPAVEHLRHLAGSDRAHNQLLEVVLLVLQLQQQPHDLVDQLVVLVPLHPPRYLHVHLEVSLHDDRAVQQPRLPVPLLEGEVAEVLAHSEVPLPDPLHQPDALQLPDYLLVLLPHPVATARQRQGQAQHVLQDLVVTTATLERQVALDQDRDLVPQRQPKEIEVLLCQTTSSQPPNAAFPQDVVVFVQQAQQVEELLVQGLPLGELLPHH